MNTLIERLSEKALQTGVPVERGADDRCLGRLLLDAGRLKAGDAERALKHAREKNIRFGEACLALDLVTQGDIEEALCRQFKYPYLHAGQANLSHELVAAYSPFSGQVEALRALRTRLLLGWFTTERKVLAVVSPSRSDGRSYLAANLAIVFSQLGEKTLLIDADMRNPRQHELFGLSNQYGLSAFLSGRANGAIIQRIRPFENLCVLPAGATPPNPLELASRQEFAALLATEARNFDVVLLDTPAAERSSDAEAIAARAGGALLLARVHRSRNESLGQLAAALMGARVELAGSVLNRY